MSSEPSSSSNRGRNKRGGLGKYLRARGRGRGSGRPAVFGERLLLEGEGELDEEAIEAAAEEARKYSRRDLGSNADRYIEPESELNSDGELEAEPEVDLSSFLERQRLADDSDFNLIQPRTKATPEDDNDVDHTLSHISSQQRAVEKKGRVQTVEWDTQLDEMNREKKAAEAAWDLKTRFRAKSEKLKVVHPPAGDVIRSRFNKTDNAYVEAPALPGTPVKSKDPMAEMEDFLDDLLS